jgi:hypothetical protein
LKKRGNNRSAAAEQALAADRVAAREIIAFLKSLCAARLGSS